VSDDEYTRDVAKRGLAAVRERRQGQQFSTSSRDAALEYMLGSQYGGRQPTDSYGKWQQSRGFRPQQYQIAVGQGDGKYNGFETEGQLKAAVLGRSEMLREEDWTQADHLRQVADQYLNEAEGQYEKSLKNAAVGIADKVMDSSEMQAMSGSKGYSAAHQRRVQPELDDQRSELNAWLADETVPYLDAVDTAELIRQTPLREYATLAGSEYGVDPNIIGGWYPQKSQIDDYRTQRDIDAIDTYGMTDAEFQQFLDEQLRAQDEQTELGQDDYDQQVTDAVFDVTGMDADQLAQAADLTTEQLFSVIDSDTYYALNDQLAQTVATSGEADEQSIREQVDEALAQAASDPALYRVLFAQWGGYGGAG
jgi:hypothetical protein